jgi:ribosomal protein S18 acetylase RimI-like enzyme
MEYKIRSAEEKDIHSIYAQVYDLAKHQDMLHRLEYTEDSLKEFLFNNDSAPVVIVTEVEGIVIGFAIYSFININRIYNPSNALYIWELYVLPKYRNKKIGFGLFKELASIAHNNGCQRVEWWVVEGNDIAVDFYNKIGATELKEISIYRMAGSNLTNLLSS